MIEFNGKDPHDSCFQLLSFTVTVCDINKCICIAFDVATSQNPLLPT